ncbi:MAG: shikimate kinase [Candidatus Margulisbacteria bacterium]|nr:shikimate kinase [Candidatus Margulisiibacteriota bacterium]
MNIILIGFMGSGKSAAGYLLAEKLRMQYLDCDALIAQAEKMSITDIFAKKGEKYFRDLETEVIKTLADYDNFVIAAGGGMVLRAENVKMLKAIGPLVLLWAEPDAIYSRVQNQTHRPLLNVPDPKAEIERILMERKPIYEKAADYTVDTTNLGIGDSADRIIQWIRSR